MARIFVDGAGTTYNATDAKFENVPFSGYTPFSFTDKTGLERKADNTAIGSMMDCGECHVGGGAMEHVPNANAGARVELRTASETALNGLWSSFSSYIDIFGPKGDGKGATYEGKQLSYADAGVLEMDCMTCHLKGYSWEDRKKAVRMAKFDASRAVGAGIATFGSYTTTSTGGRTVSYDPAKVILVGETAAEGFKLAPAVAQNILGKPDSANCATCHFSTQEEKYQVEWKKRGDYWGSSEVHGGIGCMGCHERKDLTVGGSIDPATVGTSGTANTAPGNKKLGLCDPAKGGDSDYDAQWNAMDKVAFKNCVDCHNSTDGTGATYGAPNPLDAHKRAGLVATLVQNQYVDGQLVEAKNGVAQASHLDIIDCTTCHVRKLDVQVATFNADGTFKNYSTFPMNGGAMVDGTGTDHEGRLALHDAVTVERDMKDNIALYWKNGKMFVGNFLSSWYIRDVNGFTDFNLDGRGPGIDPPLPTHIALMNKNGILADPTPLHAVAEDGVVTGAEIGKHFTSITQQLNGMIGRTATGIVKDDAMLLKLSMAGVPFKISHNTAPASQAWGAGGCADCHSAASIFYNGDIKISPKTDWKYNTNQVAPFSVVNGGADATDAHPNVVGKSGVRSMPVVVLNSTKPTQTTLIDQPLADVNKSMLLYEPTFQSRDWAWKTTITGDLINAACSIDANGKPTSSWYCATLGSGGAASGSTVTAGWLLKIEVKDDTTGAVTYRTKQISSATLTSVSELMTNLGTFTTNPAFEFTISQPAGEERIVIAAKEGYTIRISPQSDVPGFGLKNALWVAEPIQGIDGNTYNGRVDYVAYLNSITDASVGIGVDPVAAIGSITDENATKAGIQAYTNKAYTDNLVADASENLQGVFSYNWKFDDGSAAIAGATVSKTFTKAGVWAVTLEVSDEEGKIARSSQTVEVAAAPAGTVVTDLDEVAGVTSVEFTNMPTHTRIYVVWGDGKAEWITGAGDITAPHKYARYSKYDKGANYEYLLTLYVYDGSVKKETKQQVIQVSK